MGWSPLMVHDKKGTKLNMYDYYCIFRTIRHTFFPEFVFVFFVKYIFPKHATFRLYYAALGGVTYTPGRLVVRKIQYIDFYSTHLCSSLFYFC